MSKSPFAGMRYGVNGFGNTPTNPPDVFKQRGWAGMHQAWNGGANNGWLPMSVNSVGPKNAPALIGYYTCGDIPIHHLLADKFTICDNYFCSVLGPTVPNRLYWLSASIDPEGRFGGPELLTPTP